MAYRRKDGIWILFKDSLNAEVYEVCCFIDNIKCMSETFYSTDRAMEFARALAKLEKLPIIDGTGVHWNVFNNEYQRTSSKNFKGYDDVEIYDYSDEEMDSMDTRSLKTAIWAKVVAPGVLKGIKVSSKNNFLLFDTKKTRMVNTRRDQVEYVNDLDTAIETGDSSEYTLEEVLSSSPWLIIHDGYAYRSRDFEADVIRRAVDLVEKGYYIYSDPSLQEFVSKSDGLTEPQFEKFIEDLVGEVE